MTLFLRLLDSPDKETALYDAVAQLRAGEGDAFEVAPEDFRQVPGSPFAYWLEDTIRALFSDKENFPSFENEQRTVKQGLVTSDDFRFLRSWWEVNAELLLSGSSQTTTAEFRMQNIKGKQWVPFAKGGSLSPYYADLVSVINWGQDGQELKQWAGSLYGGTHWSRNIKGIEFFFRTGLTWPLRASKFSPSVLPAGNIFSIRGYAIHSESEELSYLLGLGNSQFFDYLYKVLLGRSDFPEFIVNTLKQLPTPVSTNNLQKQLGELALNCVKIKRNLDRANETSHVFHLPALLQVDGATLVARAAAWAKQEREATAQLERNQAEIDEITLRLYGIDEDDKQSIQSNSGLPTLEESANASDDTDDEPQTTNQQPATTNQQLARDLISYTVGCVFGRWDVRYAIGEQAIPELPDPFAPLPAYSPGMLQRAADALPRLRPDEDGILADDEGDPSDIVRRVRDVLDLVWGDSAEAVERELCEALSVKNLRDYLCRANKGGFWQDHIGRYSKSRRRAPIYWLLQSPKNRYALWFYYPTYNGDTLAKALQSYVEPKLRRELERLASLRAATQTSEGSARRALEREVERQEDLLNDIQEFRDRLERTARRGLRPDHNDGVLLNIAPLWELTPWPEAKRAWSELQSGKYEWSTVSKQLRGIFEAEDTFDQSSILEPSGVQSPADVVMASQREPRAVLSWLRTRGIGPAEELELTLDERINIFTGDNGLGKTFVLDAAWLVLTGENSLAAIAPLLNDTPTLRPEISFEIATPDKHPLDPDSYIYRDAKWELSSKLVLDERRDSSGANDLLGQHENDEEVEKVEQVDIDGISDEVSQGILYPVVSRAPRPGLVVYAHVDGGISVWDQFKQERLASIGFPRAIHLTDRELWWGVTHQGVSLCRGLLADLGDWAQAAQEREERSILGLPILDGEKARQATLLDSINSILTKLTSDENSKPQIVISSPIRINTIDATLYPTVKMPYGLVPINHASAAVNRVVCLVYALVWAWDEHLREALARDEIPTQQIVLLIDEVELHLHPKWQRLIFRALLDAVEILHDGLKAQYLVTTHAPLVLASLEPYFIEEKDQLFDFELEHDKVILYEVTWANLGNVNNWLTSSIFNLRQARSREAEITINAAEAYMRGENLFVFEKEGLTTKEAIHDRLREVLANHDEFWPRWIVRMDADTKPSNN